MIRKSISILSCLIAGVASIPAARADIGGYQIGVRQKFHNDSRVITSTANWQTVFGKPGLHLVAPHRDMFPRAAAVIQANPQTEGISVSKVAFSFHKHKGSLWFGTTNPVLRIEHQAADSKSSVFETITMKQMTVHKTPGDWYVAQYDVSKAKGKPILAQKIAVVAEAEGPFGVNLDGDFLVAAIVINGQPPDRYEMKVDEQTAKSTLLNGFDSK